MVNMDRVMGLDKMIIRWITDGCDKDEARLRRSLFAEFMGSALMLERALVKEVLLDGMPGYGYRIEELVDGMVEAQW